VQNERKRKGRRGCECERTRNGGKMMQAFRVFFFVLQFYFFNYWALFSFVTLIKKFVSFFQKKN